MKFAWCNMTQEPVSFAEFSLPFCNVRQARWACIEQMCAINGGTRGNVAQCERVATHIRLIYQVSIERFQPSGNFGPCRLHRFE